MTLMLASLYLLPRKPRINLKTHPLDARSFGDLNAAHSLFVSKKRRRCRQRSDLMGLRGGPTAPSGGHSPQVLK